MDASFNISARGLIVSVLIGLHVLVGCDSGPGPESDSGPKAMPRSEFRSLVMGKTSDEVIAAVGRPQNTFTPPGFMEYWYYQNGITFDPVTQKPDTQTMVTFVNGRVAEVSQ